MKPGMRLLMMEKARENTRRDGMDRRMDSPDMTMGGYDVESRFRDRRGREHYDNGGFAPMRNEMGYEGPYSGGNRYDIDVNRYEYKAPEENYRNEVRGGYDSDRIGDTRGEEGGNMRMVGFGRELYNDMRSDASIPSYREGDHMMGSKPKKGGAKSSMGLDENMAREWTSKMENEDGTKGPHWNMEQIKKVMEQRNMTGDPVAFWVAMNMMYSDYCKVAKKLGVNSVDFYAEMAKAFLEDKDTGVPDKLTAYYESIVKG